MQLVVRVVSRPHSDPKTHTARTHRGDVISFVDDNHVFSQRELTNPEWRIVKVDITLSEAMAFIAVEEDVENTKSRKWKRKFGLDLDNISFPKEIRDYISDATRVVPIFEFAAKNKNLLSNVTVVKGSAEDYI